MRACNILMGFGQRIEGWQAGDDRRVRPGGRPAAGSGWPAVQHVYQSETYGALMVGTPAGRELWVCTPGVKLAVPHHRDAGQSGLSGLRSVLGAAGGFAG